MTDKAAAYRLYDDLADWWPLISPPDEYADEAAFTATVLESATTPVHDVLELGCGGGHNAVHLKRRFTMTLTDLSQRMLEVSRRLNPECEHRRGDMRTLRLGRAFDAVFVHDAADYLVTESDLVHAAETAFDHCRPGGVAVFIPDHTRENFVPFTEHGGSDDGDRGARYLAWTPDPGPAASSVMTEYVFVLRQPGTPTRVVHETHETGLFSRAEWLGRLGDAGFDPYVLTEQTDEDRSPRLLFVGRRPA
ncbi:class I SAM-dependent methyltransferase [Phytoactinopolyspora alkaliphila]|uniref:Class I SAM-dependent methyltransferase n=1 Tax=Phytoactinopolyspora alkaliphila TaxID=1783498 RepID=A0A6N9YJ43_9ACTN|nr:class I SAM-dependent methyltransferase [Phytoactinopolyspora alkaliphila]NED94918.1 class I SAM-dependent methyltransferase [Phytoactinopolyspora alkaliphila]